MTLDEIRQVMVHNNHNNSLTHAIDLFDRGLYAEAEEHASIERQDSVFNRFDGLGGGMGHLNELDRALAALRDHIRKGVELK
jgi:hypothetical protein